MEALVPRDRLTVVEELAAQFRRVVLLVTSLNAMSMGLSLGRRTKTVANICAQVRVLG